MRAALVQFTPEFPGHDANWERIFRWAERVDADVTVFPELSSSGYGFHRRAEALPSSDTRDALRPLEEIARRRRRLLVGGFAERAGGRLYNSAYAISPAGSRVYRKLHRWNWEKRVFAQGGPPVLTTFGGHRFGVEICYDLQFPELASYYSRRGAEALLVPTAWAKEPTGRVAGLEPVSHLAIATAFSHGIYVLVANHTGTEGGARFPGESGVADPFGRFRHLGRAEGVLTVELDFGLVPRAKRPNPRNQVDRDARLTVGIPSGARDRDVAVPGGRRRPRPRRPRR